MSPSRQRAVASDDVAIRAGEVPMGAVKRQPRQTWQSANQRYLMASLDRVRVALERHALRRRATGVTEAASDDSPDTEPALPPSPKMTGDAPAALERLGEVFGL